MRALSHNQNSELSQIDMAQIDMAQIARDSSDAILGFNYKPRNQLRMLQHQKLAHHAIISLTAITAIIAIGFVTF